MAGDLNVTWIHGSSNCAATTDPPIQVHQFDANTFILRQSKCSDPVRSFEAPFMYLLFGQTRALLLDTGASQSAAVFPLAARVNQLLANHAATTGATMLPLLIAHSHSHGDHAAGDGQFAGHANTTIVPLGLAGVKAFYHLPSWPNGTAQIDLGGRILDVLPAPGHESSHIVLYDRTTQVLLTGDTLYPGLLVVNDWSAAKQTAARLTAFVQGHPVSHVLGAHVEMRDMPKRWFGLGMLFQPEEHVLQLSASHVTELDSAFQSIGATPATDRRNDFIIYPSTDPLPAP